MCEEYTSNELFHFVGRGHPEDDEGNFETLKKILSVGCVSHKPHENKWGTHTLTINWEKSLVAEELIVPTVTCYADIPLRSLAIHVKHYGRFGLSLPKELLIQYATRPVMYIPMRQDDWKSISGVTLLRDLEAVYKGYHKHVSAKLIDPKETLSRSLGAVPNTEQVAIRAMGSVFVSDFLAFIKPFNSHLDVDHPDNFYMEREWRKFGNMEFNPDDVCHVIVAKGYRSRVVSAFPCYSGRIIEI